MDGWGCSFEESTTELILEGFVVAGERETHTPITNTHTHAHVRARRWELPPLALENLNAIANGQLPQRMVENLEMLSADARESRGVRGASAGESDL